MSLFKSLTTTALTALSVSLTPLALASTQEATPPSQSQVVDTRYSLAQVERDVTLAKSAFQDIHPGYDRFTPSADIDAAFDDLLDRARAQNGLAFSDLYLGLSEAMALIRCDHTKAELPRALQKARATAPVYLPLRWTIVENRAIIEAAPVGSGLSRGDEILSIDGRTITELQDALHRYISVDGYNDHVRDSVMTASTELTGGAVDHFGALLWNVPAKATLKVSGANAEPRTLSLPRVGYDDWKTLALANDARNFKDAVSVERVGDRAAILRVDSFVNYREPVDPDTLYRPVFDMLKAEGRDRLILDIRRNGGGSTDASQGLFAYFIPKKRRMKSREIFKTLDHSAYEAFISTWDDSAINPPRIAFSKTDDGEYALRGMFSDNTNTVKPAKPGYIGDLIILTSRDNSSGATNLISAIQDARPVTLIGEKTGGNPLGPTAGTIFFLKLPESEITLRLPVIRFENNVRDLPKGQGLSPDIAAPVTVESLREGRDPALDAALDRVAN